MKKLFLLLLFFSNVICNQGFTEGTLVKTTAGYKAIEKIHPGDYVYCADNNRTCTQPVKTVTQELSKSIIAVKVGNTTILCGPEHRFYLPQEQRWEQAQYLTPDHILISYHNEHVHITDVQIINQPAQLFDLTVDTHHTFFVSEQDIVVHNNVWIIATNLVEKAPTIVENAVKVIGGAAAVWGARKYNKSQLDNYHHQQSHQEAQTKRDSEVYGRQNADGTITPVIPPKIQECSSVHAVPVKEFPKTEQPKPVKEVRPHHKTPPTIECNKQQETPKTKAPTPKISADKEKPAKTVDDILAGTKPGKKTNGPSKQFEKPGGYDEALDDFKKLKPTDIKNIVNQKGGPMKIGKLPDGRTVIVRADSKNGTPTLEIQSNNSNKKIKIRYIS